MAIWKVYLLGRFGWEKDLGYVIASSRDMDWVRSFAQLGCDIVKRLPEGADLTNPKTLLKEA